MMGRNLFKGFRGRIKSVREAEAPEAPPSSATPTSPTKPSSLRRNRGTSKSRNADSNASIASAPSQINGNYSVASNPGVISKAQSFAASSPNKTPRPTTPQTVPGSRTPRPSTPQTVPGSFPITPHSAPRPQKGSPLKSSYFGKKRHQQERRRSLGDPAFVGSSTSSGSPSTLDRHTSPTRALRYKNSRKNIQQKRSAASKIVELGKKEVTSSDELEGGDDGDDFFESPEFRSRVAHEAADLDKEGNMYFERGDYDKAFMSYERALKLKRASLQVDSQKKGSQDLLTETESQKASILASVATSINNMTYLRQRAGQASADETMAAYLKSLQIKREILGPNHLSVGKTLNNIGSVFYLKKEYVPALKAYENAREIMSEQLGETHLDVGTVLSNIGDVHSAMSKRKEALRHYRMALDIRWAQLGRNDPKVVRLMEQTAALETGKQPRKKPDDLSDSEDEEFAVEDRKRREEFVQECQQLQEELVEDVKFFDLVERTLAIEVVKQKTKFVRSLRRAQMGDSIRSDMFETSEMFENMNFDAHNAFDDNDDSISVMSAPPDLDVNESDETPEVLAFLKEIGAKPSPQAKINKTRNSRPSPITVPRTPTRAGASKTPKPTTPATTSTTQTTTPPSPLRPETPLMIPPAPLGPETPTPGGHPSTTNPSLETPLSEAAPSPADSTSDGGKNKRSPTERQPPTPQQRQQNMVTPQNRPQAKQRPKSTPSPSFENMAFARKSRTSLTPEERKLALMSVKERVATLKSRREQDEVHMTPEEAAEARRRASTRPKCPRTPTITTPMSEVSTPVSDGPASVS